MAVFTKTIIRCWIDVTSRTSFLDVLTGATPEFWNGTDIELQLAFGIGSDADAQLLDISNFDSVTAKVLAKTKTGLPYIEKTVASGDLNTALTLAEWQAGTEQHATISIPYNETELPLGGADKAQFWMVVHGVTSDVPVGRDTYGGTILTAVEDGIPNDDVTGPVQAGNIIPVGATYDGAGEYELVVTEGATYAWTKNANDTGVANGFESYAASAVFIALGAAVTLQGTAGQPVTAVVRYDSYLTSTQTDARYFFKNQINNNDLLLAPDKTILFGEDGALIPENHLDYSLLDATGFYSSKGDGTFADGYTWSRNANGFLKAGLGLNLPLAAGLLFTDENGDVFSGDSDDITEGAANLFFTNARADARIALAGGVEDGFAPLDAGLKIPASYLPDSILGQVEWQGTWDASTNTPAIPAADFPYKGHYYVVATAGATEIDGLSEWKVGDWIICNGVTWEKVDNTDQVSSVFGRSGAVVAANNDYTWAQIDKTISSLADLATRSASDLSSGTLPDARFPATLPAASGVNLTALNATQLTSGTLPDARFPATLPAASGVNLTALNATQLTSGTVAPARLGTGSGGATKFLREDNTWQTIAGGGDVLSANNLSEFTATATTARGNISAAKSGANSDLTSITGLTGTLVLDKNVSATPDYGFFLKNTTAATSGNQKYSPAMRWSGQGWKTDATAGSQAVDFHAYGKPVQGSANPSGLWVLENSINGAAFGEVLSVSSAGLLSLGGLGQTELGIKNLSLYDDIGNPILQCSDSSVLVVSGSGGSLFTIDRDNSEVNILDDGGSTILALSNSAISIQADDLSDLISINRSTYTIDFGGSSIVTFYGTVGISTLNCETFNCSGAYLYSGTQVVAAQGTAVAYADDAASAITQLNALIDRLQAGTGHGLIASNA